MLKATTPFAHRLHMVDLTLQAVVTVTHTCAAAANAVAPPTTHHCCMCSCDCGEGRASMRTSSDMPRSIHPHPPRGQQQQQQQHHQRLWWRQQQPSNISIIYCIPFRALFCSSLWRAAILALQTLAAFTCCSFWARVNFYLLQVWSAERQSLSLLFSRASHTRNTACTLALHGV